MLSADSGFNPFQTWSLCALANNSRVARLLLAATIGEVRERRGDVREGVGATGPFGRKRHLRRGLLPRDVSPSRSACRRQGEEHDRGDDPADGGKSPFPLLGLRGPIGNGLSPD